MAESSRVTQWIDGYIQGWNSNDSADIGALFSADGQYYTAPFREPWRGREGIVAGWLDRKDEPGEATFDWHLVIETPDLVVVQGTTTYPDETFSNLWLIRLDEDGRCHEFTEWWMDQPRS